MAGRYGRARGVNTNTWPGKAGRYQQPVIASCLLDWSMWERAGRGDSRLFVVLKFRRSSGDGEWRLAIGMNFWQRVSSLGKDEF